MHYAQHLSNDALEALRRRAVDMVQSGVSQRATAKALGVHRNTVCLWCKWLRQGGAAALKPKPRGRPVGSFRGLRHV